MVHIYKFLSWNLVLRSNEWTTLFVLNKSIKTKSRSITQLASLNGLYKKINKNKTHCHAHFWNQLTKSLQRRPIFCNEYYKAELLTKSPRILSYFLSILQPRIYRRTWLIYDNSVCSIGIFLTSSTLIAELIQ